MSDCHTDMSSATNLEFKTKKNWKTSLDVSRRTWGWDYTGFSTSELFVGSHPQPNSSPYLIAVRYIFIYIYIHVASVSLSASINSASHQGRLLSRTVFTKWRTGTFHVLFPRNRFVKQVGLANRWISKTRLAHRPSWCPGWGEEAARRWDCRLLHLIHYNILALFVSLTSHVTHTTHHSYPGVEQRVPCPAYPCKQFLDIPSSMATDKVANDVKSHTHKHSAN